MGSQTQATPFVERRKTGHRPESQGWNWFLLAITVLLMAGYFISTKKLYKPGDKLGYGLGLVGGLMLLSMLLYSLRKRASFMKGLGLLPIWFKWHMVFGVLAPTVIMYHSTFYIGSINAGVALICMMLVSGSGIFGRFFYTKIHNGLFGRQVTLQGVHEDMEKTGSFKRSFMSFAPDIEQSLDRFRVRGEGMRGGLRDFLSIGFEAASLSRSLAKDLHRVMYAQAREKKLDAGQIGRVNELYEEYVAQIRDYLKTVRNVAQFRTYERLFSWWHIFHIPLVYMMMFSGIFHVIAVHMY